MIAPSTPLGTRVRAGLSRLVGMLGAVLAALRDSPLAELDLRELFASWRTGALLAVCTLVVGVTALVAAAVSSEAPFRAFVAKLGMGHYLVAAVQLAIGLLLTIAVPVRAVGVVEGPRWRGFFDQLVTSGMRPWEYYLGRALAAQGLIALVFAGTAPLLLALALTDPPPARTVLANHALLLVYAELLLASTLGIGALVHESAAALGTVALATTIGGLAFAPIPSALVALTPARAIAAPFLPLLSYDLTPGESDVLFGPPRIFSVELPLAPYGVGLSLLVGALALSCCFVARPHAFVPGLNNFGAVVLAGDRRRSAILRFRPTLVRRSELAFFFENHGPEHAWLAPWARLARAAAIFALVALLPLGALWNDALLGIVKPREHVFYGLSIVSGLFGVFCLGIAPVLAASSKLDARIDLTLGRARLSMVLADVLAYLVFAAVLLRTFEWATDQLLASSAISFAPVFGTPFKSKLDMVDGFGRMARIISVTGLALVLVQKIFGLRLNDAVGGVVIAWFLMGATAILPVAVEPRDLKVNEAHARDPDQEKPERTPEENAVSLLALHLCPAFQIRLIFDTDVLEDIPLPRGPWTWLARNGFWAIYPALETLLLIAIVQIVRQRRRADAAELAEPLATSPPATPEVRP